jgi:hypothetical protein
LHRKQRPAHAHAGLSDQKEAAPFDNAGGRQVLVRCPLDEEDVQRMDGECRQRPEEKRRVGIDIGAESADHQDDNGQDGGPLQRGADMHGEQFALEQHRSRLAGLQAFARRADRFRHGLVAMAAREVDDVLVCRGRDAFTHIADGHLSRIRRD